MNDIRHARILYVDDDPILARLIEKQLGRKGFDVVHAGAVADVLPALEQSQFDVLVLDHYLDNGTGIDVLNQVKASGHSMPVVYVTGSSDVEIAINAMKAGATDYVIKSPGHDFVLMLETALQHALENARLRREKDEADQEVRRARDHAEILLAEVNHRVANGLALVAAFVRMQISAVDDPAAKHALAETQARITAIGGIHRSLYTSSDVRVVEMDAYLRDLVHELGSSMQQTGPQAQVKLDVEPMKIGTDKAVSLAVMVTEMMTNAFKYAYPEGASGEVRVSLRRHGDGMALLSVEDDGIGWSGDGKPQGTGIGSRILSAMAKNIDAKLQYGSAEHGTRVTLEFKI